MITDIEDYFTKGCGRCPRFSTPDCSTQQWSAGLEVLRAVCLDAGLDETVKWGHPCYVHAGRNIAIIGALRNEFRLSFFDASLMKDPDGILEKQGPNTAHADMIRFTDAARVAALAPTVKSYLKEAMGYAEAGVRPTRESHAIALPEALIEALAADPDLSVAFDRLTPGRRKSYVIHLNSAKKKETQMARIERARDKIFAGKGAMER
ncbi:MAG: YdeI/OmpD-associated family protein [Pseudomonadota bacterium]